MKRDFKGVWIPREIWLSKELSLQEKVLLAEIESLDNENGCYATNDYFAEFFGLSKRQVSRSISNLKEKEFINVKLIYKEGTKQIEKRVIRVVHYGDSKGGVTPIDKNVHRYGQNCRDPIDRNGSTPIDKSGVENNPCINNPFNNPSNKDIPSISKVQEIYNHYLSKDIVKHHKITSDMRTAINARLRDYSYEQLIQAIDNYSTIYHSNDYWFDTKYTLADLMRPKDVRKFIDEADPLRNYLKNDKRNQFIPMNDRYDPNKDAF